MSLDGVSFWQLCGVDVCPEHRTQESVLWLLLLNRGQGRKMPGTAECFQSEEKQVSVTCRGASPPQLPAISRDPVGLQWVMHQKSEMRI